jgi:hypothetical protein
LSTWVRILRQVAVSEMRLSERRLSPSTTDVNVERPRKCQLTLWRKR